ncbi:MAG: ABC transporter permease [Eubacteriales bacterium]|nr:ABC transporter permease [Eubacteriales bacterium]
MKKLFALTKRNLKEMLRDPLSIVFCLIFPVIMLVLMQAISMNISFIPDNFKIQSYASGICVFGYAFIGMFVSLQIATDKNTSFIKRLNIAPTKKWTYYLSFVCSSLPLAFAQTILFFAIALIFKFPFNVNLILSIIYLIPSALLYITLGIMIGIICSNEKQTGPISSIFISLVGIFGGVFMPLSSLSNGFLTFVNALPFSHTVMIASELHTIGTSAIYPHILFILGYTALFITISIIVEKIKEKK